MAKELSAYMQRIQRRIAFETSLLTAIKTAREMAALTPQQMAGVLAISPSIYTELEGGRVNLTVRQLYIIAEACKVLPQDLMRDAWRISERAFYG